MSRELLRWNGATDTEVRGSDDELNLRDIWRVVWRRKLVFFLTVCVITGAAITFVKMETPLYKASALVRIQTSDPTIVQIAEVAGEFVADGATIASEIELLQSPAFGRKMVTELGLLDDPEFNPRLREKPVPFWEEWGLLEMLPPQVVEFLGLNEEEDGDEDLVAGMPGVSPEEYLMNLVTRIFLANVEVMQVAGSYVLDVSVWSPDGVKAANLANAIADAYLADQLERKYEIAERASEWLRGRIEELRGRVMETEARIIQYHGEKGLVSENRANPVLAQFGQMNTQLAMAQAERAEAEARYTQVRNLLNSKGGLQVAANVLDSPLLGSLRAQETELIRRKAELSTIYGARHPQMVNLQAELGSVRHRMLEEVQRIAQDLADEIAVAQARERELQRALDGLEEQATTIDVASIELRDLQREAEANRELFNAFLGRFREIIESQELQEADATVLSPAELPLAPSYPNNRLIVSIAFAASLLLGAAMVFLVERWTVDFGFRSSEEVAAVTGARALALVPDLTRRDVQGMPSEEYVLQKPNSAFSEAIQRVRTSLFLGNPAHAPKTVLVTSSVPLEGKSFISSSLARQSARSGLKVLLIDGDLRRPRLHEVMRVANHIGLTEILAGTATIEESVRADEKSGLHFMPAGSSVASPPDLFRTEAMKSVLKDLNARYDLIVIDSPPVVAVSDSLILSGIVDRTVYVIRWEKTPRNIVVAGMRQLVEAGANVAGVVLSRVNIRKHARYGYSDSGYYSGYYRRYYIN